MQSFHRGSQTSFLACQLLSWLFVLSWAASVVRANVAGVDVVFDLSSTEALIISIFLLGTSSHKRSLQKVLYFSA